MSPHFSRSTRLLTTVVVGVAGAACLAAGAAHAAPSRTALPDTAPRWLGRATPAAGPDDRALLDLLANGLPDAAIAHQLGCSERTLRRRVTHLSDLLDASSRFQLGALAHARGWV